jgi:hypothetical protein
MCRGMPGPLTANRSRCGNHSRITGMSVHRLAKYQADDPFTRVPNTSVNDPRLDLKARGLLLFMLSKPDGWTFRERSLANQVGVGRDQVRAALQKLIDCGYVVRRWQACEDAPPIMVTEVYDTPIQPEVGFPEVGKPDSGKTQPISNELVLVTKDISKAKRNTSMTEDWQPNSDNWQAIISRHSDLDCQTELDNFRDHWIGKGERRADWNASLRTWMRNADKWKRVNPADPPKNKPANVGSNGRTFCDDCRASWAQHDQLFCDLEKERL